MDEDVRSCSSAAAPGSSGLLERGRDRKMCKMFGRVKTAMLRMCVPMRVKSAIFPEAFVQVNFQLQSKYSFRLGFRY